MVAPVTPSDTTDVPYDRQADTPEEIELGKRLAVSEARVELLEREREALRGDLDRAQRLAEQLASSLAAEQQRTLRLLAARSVPQLQEEQQQQPQADTDKAAPKPRRWWQFTRPR